MSILNQKKTVFPKDGGVFVLSDSVTNEYSSDDFIANPIKLVSSLGKYFRGVLNKRLREVRALVGFAIDPTQDKQFIQSISKRNCIKVASSHRKFWRRDIYRFQYKS